MSKYFRFLLLFSKFSFIRSAMFHLDFWLKFLMDLAYYGVSLVIVFVIYSHVDDIRGWSRNEFLLLLSIFFLIDSFYMVFIATNAWNVSRLVNTGQFDYCLTKPISAFFYTFFNSVEISSALNFVFTLPFSVYAVSNMELSVFQTISYIFLTFTGLVVFFCLRALTAMAAFWSQSPYPIERIWLSLYDYMQSPRAVYPPAVRFIFLSVLPIFFIASIPAEAVVKNAYELILMCVLMSTLLVIVTLLTWNRAVLNYRSASS